jgi:hypothetical protein
MHYKQGRADYASQRCSSQWALLVLAITPLLLLMITYYLLLLLLRGYVAGLAGRLIDDA